MKNQPEGFYRDFIPKYLKERKQDFSGHDVYVFGVYAGNTFRRTHSGLRGHGVDVHKIWGFDGFIGLPNAEGRFIKGDCNDVAKRLHIEDTIPEIVRILMKRLPQGTGKNTEIVPGMLADTLNNDLLKKRPRKAIWIDCDVDLYSSTMTALDFMATNKLIQVGTVISYDDWWSGHKEYEGGESLAHKELCEKYGIEAKAIFTKLSYNTANVEDGVPIHKVFEVTKI